MSAREGERARIRRGPAQPRARVTAKRPGAKAPPRRQSTAAQALATIPLPAATLKRAANWLLIGLLGAGVVAGVVAMKVPQMIGNGMGEAVGALGFRVRHIEIANVDKMDRSAIFAVAADQQSRAMPLVDLEDTRARLLRFGWIQDARVSRRLPDTLVVDVVERRAAAVWQHHQKLVLIDRDGTVIAPVPLDEMPNLPLVIGPGANRQATALNSLIETAPALKPVLAGATWVGSRRWDLRFLSGETLALPEGQQEAITALAKFTELDGRARLLGQGFVRFDMRVPDRFVVRVSKMPGHSVAGEAEEKKAKADAAAKAAADSI